jgi:hypothetical protein
MNKQNKVNAVLTVLISVALSLGCSSGANQTAEANKLVEQANKKLEDKINSQRLRKSCRDVKGRFQTIRRRIAYGPERKI